MNNIRDEFAARAMQSFVSILANKPYFFGKAVATAMNEEAKEKRVEIEDVIARDSYKIADAMIRVRNS